MILASMTNRKLLVLISGSFRNFDYVWPRNLRTLKELGIPFSVHVHTWSTNPPFLKQIFQDEYRNRFHLYPLPQDFRQWSEIITKESFSNIPGIDSITIEKAPPESTMAEEFNLDTSDSNLIFRGQLNSCYMYLGIERIRQETQHLQSEFTHFLRLRPDFILPPKGLGEVLKTDLAFFGMVLESESGPVSDQCFGGRLENPDFILGYYETLTRVTGGSDWQANRKNQILAEDVIHKHFAKWRISKEVISVPINSRGRIAYPQKKLDLGFSKIKFHLVALFQHNVKVLNSKFKQKLKPFIKK
jgi:hypothetical protein